ncbi:mucin-2-like isoform X3 [Halichondria panicea]
MLQKKMLSKVGSAVFCLATVLSLQVLWCSTASAQITDPAMPTTMPTISTTTMPTISTTTMPTTSTTMPSTSTTTMPTTMSTDPTVLPPEAIIGIAVGGAAFLVLLLCCCVCLCCCCVRRRRRKSYNPGPTQLSTTLTYNATPSDMNGFHDNKANENEFEMQMNIADQSVVVSGTSYGESVETRILSTRQVNPSKPQAMLPPDKGYVKMISAAATASSTEEVDGIYLNADTAISADITPLSGSRPPVSLLKSSSSRERLEEPVEHVEEGQEDLYVETNVFVEDREQQHSDSYYNKDTIETIRQNRSLIDVLDPSQTHTVYANIDPPPTPEHTLKPIEDYESVDEFLGNGSRAPSPPPNTEYYNFKPPSSSVQDDDYNYVEVTKPVSTETENPYLLEDNQYIYMAHSGSNAADQQTATSTTEEDSSSYQNIPDFVGTGGARERMDSKGYTHLEYEGGERPIAGQSASTDNKPHTSSKTKVMAELHFPPKSGSTTSDTSVSNKKQYVNLLLGDRDEELYEELT